VVTSGANATTAQAGPAIWYGFLFGSRAQAASGKQQAAKKYLTGPVNYEMIPYNLKRKEKTLWII
tara:strand:+ start:239 stop:433 length:195 start_codon:yes stop_codon:yes gene_type:complete